MIATALILLTRGWQIGPEQGPSAELPLPAKLFGLCDHRTSTLWGGQRRLAGPQANPPLPSLGGTGARPGPLIFKDDFVNDNRNMLLAIVLSALVLIGWSLLSDKFFPTAGPQTQQVEDGKVQSRPAAAGRSRRRRAAGDPRPRGRACRNAARANRDAAASQGSINLKGARFDDLVLVRQRETIAKNSPPVRLLSPAGRQGQLFRPVRLDRPGRRRARRQQRLDRQRAGADARASRSRSAGPTRPASASSRSSRSTTAICSPSSSAS